MKRGCAKLSEPHLDFRIVQSRIYFDVESFDDLDRRVPRSGDAIPGAGLAHKVIHGWHIRERV
jgi:hypothetical protein